ncbi:unnamed protein product [Macrosiphum euphorbiae]|nr:unnamed protein product [Macrosiphum euphorbiae]
MMQVFNSTINQSNDLWKRERYFRLSASAKAHKIKTYRNWSDKGLLILCSTLLKENKLGKQGKINVTYGQQNEPIALEVFKQMYNKDVLNCGLIVDVKRPWLCASPDGLILNESGTIEKVLEIKCPISCKKKPIVDSNKNINVKYLEWDN